MIQSHMRTQNRFALTQQGFALVLVLWVLSLLTIMAGSFALSMRRESSIITGLKNNAAAAAVAESGMTIAELMLLNPDPNKRWSANGSIYQINDAELLGKDNAEVRVRLLAESGKIDINKADQKLLAGVMAHSPIEDEKDQLKLVGAILDWRDQDDLINIDGAEKKEYKEAGLSYEPRNRPFQSVDELQLVLGMNEATYEWLTPLITVYSGQAKVTRQYASKEVLTVLPDTDQELINEYIAARLASTANHLPAPSIPFGATERVQTEQNPGQLGALTIFSEALLDDGSRAVISAVIKTGGGSPSQQPFQVLEWHRNTVNADSLFADTVGTSTISELLVKPYAESEFKH